MDRQTDTTKLILAFRNFADAPKKVASEGSRMWRVLANLVNCLLLSNGLSPGF